MTTRYTKKQVNAVLESYSDVVHWAADWIHANKESVNRNATREAIVKEYGNLYLGGDQLNIIVSEAYSLAEDMSDIGDNVYRR